MNEENKVVLTTPAQWAKRCIKEYGYGVNHKLIAGVQAEAIAWANQQCSVVPPGHDVICKDKATYVA